MAGDAMDWRVDDATAVEVMWDASTAAIARLIRTTDDPRTIAGDLAAIRDATTAVDPTDRDAVLARTRELTERKRADR